jgi:hypothetical protein
LPLADPTIDETYSLVPSTTDFGDAPDSAPGVGPGNYQTKLADNGPRHTIIAGLKLGANVDEEPDVVPDSSAQADGLFAAPDKNDEDGLSNPLADLTLTIGTQPTVNVRATNTTGAPAMLYGWIDYNRDGVFDNTTERASIAVPTGTNNAIFTLSFPITPLSTSAGATYARFRLSTDFAAANPIGLATDGEVEDYVAKITKISDSTANAAKNKKIASGTNGGPTLMNLDRFGKSVASLGDLDGDGVSDLAVGAYRDDTGGTSRGAVYVLFMNADGTVKGTTKIASDLNGGPALANADNFGRSVAPLGDLDGDGLIELAVAADEDDTGGTDRGSVYVLFMKSNGTVKSKTKIASGLNGGPTLQNDDSFGTSVASLGDLDGDGITDVAVGSVGNSRVGVYVLFLNTDGTVKSNIRIASGLNGGPTLGIGDDFGRSIASVGDLDGDGITDLAVGTPRDDAESTNDGAIYILFLKTNGTVKSTKKIASATNGGPSLARYDNFGSALASLGDLDGDGVTDLAAGAYDDDTGGTRRGAVYVLLLNTNGTVKSSSKIANATNGGPILADSNFFGGSIASLGDLDGDGITDLAVGADHDATGGTERGAMHILFLKPQVVPHIAGDYNLNGTVDAADFVLWRRWLNTSVPNWSGADGNGNGVVDAADHDVWRANFGYTLPMPAAGSESSGAGGPTPQSAQSLPEENAEAFLKPKVGERLQVQPIAPAQLAFSGSEPRATFVTGSAAKTHRSKARATSESENRFVRQDRALAAWLTVKAPDRWRESPADVFKDAASEVENLGPRWQLELALDLAFESLNV